MLLSGFMQNITALPSMLATIAPLTSCWALNNTGAEEIFSLSLP